MARSRADQVVAGRAGHHDVEEGEVEGPGPHRGARLVAVGDGQRRVAGAVEDAADRLADVDVVVGDQDAAGAAAAG